VTRIADRSPRGRLCGIVAAGILGIVAVGAVVTAADRSAAAGQGRTAAYTPLPTAGRLLDTRPGAPTIDGQLAGGGLRQSGTVTAIPLTGRVAVPAEATSVVVNITADAPEAAGYLTVFPCGAEVPVASNLNFRAGRTVAVLATSRLAADGSICVFNHGSTHVIADVAGWFGPSDVEMLPVPRRLLDTRPGAPTADGSFAGAGARPAGSTLRLPVAGRAGVPGAARTVVLSVTVDAAAQTGYVTVVPCDGPPTTASTVNHGAGDTVANAALTRLGPAGEVCLFTSGQTDLIVDVAGWVSDAALQPLDTPRRVLDTRPGAFTADGQAEGIGRRAAGSTLDLQVAGRVGVPADAGAVVLNVAADAARSQGFVTVHPGGSDRPTASNLNYRAGDTIANAVIAPVGTGGGICVFTSAATDLVIDVVGWLPGPAAQAGAGCPASPLFPSTRVVALYGNDVAAALGVLGEQPPAEAAQRLATVAAPFDTGDRPVRGAFELIATIANSAPGPDGLYRSPSSAAQVQRYLDVAAANDLLLILDIQPGRSDFLTELRRYDAFLRHPNVHAALDPEWHVGADQVPGQTVGQVSAAEVNAVADYLSSIVVEEGIPEKLLVVHQFQERMITERDQLREPPGVLLTIHMDGFGTREQKLATYGVVAVDPPLNNGFKLFYDEDIDMFTPSEVLALDPVPDLITYQ
jgi:hypothetical protein